MTDKIKGFVPKTFNDAGTEITYAGGKEYDFDAGTHANYVAAGLIEEAPPKAASAPDTNKAKT